MAGMFFVLTASVQTAQRPSTVSVHVSASVVLALLPSLFLLATHRPQPSPLKSPPAPVAAAPPGSTSKPGSINWRAAASAAASAVMSGLSSSPQPGWHANTFNSLSGGGGRVKAGARQQLYAGGAAAPAAGGVGVGGPAAREVFAQPLTSEGDCLDVVVAAPTSSSGSSTSRLIHQLASRAAEAQRLLQSLQ